MASDAVWQARLERERNARRAAERLLETRAEDLLEINRRAARGKRGLLPYALAGALLVAASLAGYVVVQRQSGAIATREAEALTQALASAIADDIGRMLDSADLLLRYVEARSAAPGGAAAGGSALSVPDVAPVRDVLAADAAGRVFAATHPRFLGGSVARLVDLGALARAPGDLWSGNPVAMAAFAPLGARDAMVIPLARAIRDAAGDFAGVAVALIDLAHLDTVARQSVRALEAVASIHAPDGRLMASSDRDGADRGSMAPPPWFLRGGIAPGGTGSFTGSDGRGRSLTASIAITRRIPLVVEVHKTTETVQSHTREHVVIYATTVGIVTLAALALVGVLARRRYLSATAQASLQALLADQRRNHAELQVLIAAMPGTLMRIALAANGGWRSTYVAPSFASLTGSPAHQIGSDWLAVRSAAAAAAAFDDALREAATEGEASVEFLLRHADGSDRRLAVRMTAGAQAEDHAEVISIWSDVTRERELERQLGHANKMAQLGEVATGVAHELNQPLATMSMAAENAISLLPRLPGSAERLRAKLETVVAMTTRARDVVDHMRIFGRIDTAAAAPVDLERVVRNARELVAERLRRADVSAIMCFQPDLPLVPAKEVPLEQVIINLLANACDAYIARAQPGPRPVTIVSAVEPGWVVLTIHDRAGGIPPDIIERIFEPFFTTKPVGKGTGLGLSLSFGIVADLGGVLSAANRDGGALFTIRLPLGRLP